MEHHSESRKKISVNETAQLSSRGNKAGYLQDNRPQSSVQKVLLSAIERPGPLVQQPVYQLQSMSDNNAVMQLARIKTTPRKVTSKRRTLSGHGGLRRGPKNTIRKFRVPKGKSVMRPAPPGATLGNLSMLLNEKKNLSRSELLKLMKVSTTQEIWSNKAVVGLIKGSIKITKTKTQEKALNKLLKGGYSDLTGGEKGSLTKLESKKEFEEWAKGHVESEAFKTFGEGEEMEDMELTPFEDKLKSKSPHDENEYVKSKTILSDYIGNNSGLNDFVVNACSYDTDAPFTGFQIDHKKDK